jgi:hypothetical protein
MFHLKYSKMDNYKNFIDSVKDLSFDLLGFMIPGAIAQIYLLFSIDEKIIQPLRNSTIDESLYAFSFFMTSYILGYIAMGLSLIKLKICNYQIKIENAIANSSLFKDSIEKYKIISNESFDVSKYTTRELRTRIMSFIPEADIKIYTFRYRSDLCEHILTILFSLAVLLLFLSLLATFCDIQVARSGCIFICFHIIVLLCCWILTYVRNRFYDISMRVSFSIFLAKKIKDA